MAKGELKPRSIVSKMTAAHTLPSTPLDLLLDYWLCSVDYSNHMLVGGFSVNSLYQQGGLFALSVKILSAIGQTFM